MCRIVPSGLVGFGDTIDQSDTCTQNPNDPICVAYYGSAGAAQAASVQSTATPASMPGGGLCTLDSDCPAGFTCNVVSGGCEPMASFASKGSTPSPAAAAASVAAGTKPMSLWLAAGVLALGGVGFLAIRHYEKKSRR
jgi:hypothetical protein